MTAETVITEIETLPASDVLHVVCALALAARQFLTFDDRRRKLAGAVGLKTIKLL